MQNESHSLLGYQFHSSQWFVQALTHASFARTQNYELLEFVGDRFLNLFATLSLIKQDAIASQGELSVRLSSLICSQTLAKVFDHLDQQAGLTKRLRIQVEQLSDKIKSDVIESLIAAVYYDSYSQTGCTNQAWQATESVVAQILTLIDQRIKPAWVDAKSALQRHQLSQRPELPTYQVIERQGADHAPWFRVEVRVWDRQGQEARFQGQGGSIKAAEQAAASQALTVLAPTGARR